MDIKIIIALVFMVVLVGVVAQSAGIGSTLLAVPKIQGTGWLEIFTPIEWVMSAASVFIGLLTFTLPGVPVVVNTLIMVPFGLGLLYMILKLVRGTG